MADLIGFPPLPDSEGSAVRPHSDGQPKRKACEECAFRLSDPQEMGRQYQDRLLEGTPDTLFYCIHRLEQGRHRVCACYAAFHPEQRIVLTAGSGT